MSLIRGSRPLNFMTSGVAPTLHDFDLRVLVLDGQ